MSEKKIVVPEGMLDAATQGATSFDGKVSYPAYIKAALEAALRWLSANPVVPSDADITEVIRLCIESRYMTTAIRYFVTEWQRRMFLAPEPEVPEEDREYQQQLEKFCGDGSPEMKAGFQCGWLAAYRRGRESR